MLPTTFQDEDNCLKTVDGSQHDNCNKWELTVPRSDFVNEVTEVNDRRRKDERSEKIDKDDESHTEATESAHVIEQNQFHEIMDSTRVSQQKNSNCTY